jgi:DNA-binding SARP family transcriptional activator
MRANAALSLRRLEVFDAGNAAQSGGSPHIAELTRLRALHKQFAAATRALSALIEGMSNAADSLPGLVMAAESALLLPAPIVEVRLLGPFEVTVDGSPVALRSGGKPVAVLKFMAAIGDQPIARDVILEALWPDVPSGAAGSRLRAAMHALRRMFGDDDAGVVEVLEYELGQYRLFPGATFATDVARFEEAAEAGRMHDRNGEVEEAIACYTEADALYRGDYLEGDPYSEWTLVRREQLRDTHLTLLARLAHLYLEQGDDVSAIALSHKVVRRDECNDEAYRILIAAHSRRGERTAAERWFEIGERALQGSLAARPTATAPVDVLERARTERASAQTRVLSGRAQSFAMIEAERKG